VTGPLTPAVGKVYADLETRSDPASADRALGDIDRRVHDRLSVSGAEGGRLWSTGFGEEMRKALGVDASGNSSRRPNSIVAIVDRALGGAVRDAVRLENAIDPLDSERAGARSGGIFGGAFGNAFKSMFRDLGTSISNFFSNTVSPALSNITGLFSGGGAGGGIGAGVGPMAIIQALIQFSMMGTIVTLITAAVYGLQAFVSLLYLIPSLLAGIVLQFIALKMIFSGLGPAIAGVLSAKNLTEVNAALVGVNKTVAVQLRQLYDWKLLFQQIGKEAQQGFFSQIGATRLTDMLHAIGPALGFAIVNISMALGRVVDDLLRVFASPAMAEMLRTIGQATAKWLVGFGPALATLIDGFNKLAIATRPFLDWFGEKFNNVITKLGNSLAGLGQNKSFQDWIESAKRIMPEFLHLAGAFIGLFVSIIQAFTKADNQSKKDTGDDFLTRLRKFVDTLSAFLQSDAGQKALLGLIYLMELAAISFTGSVEAITLLLGVIWGVVTFMKVAGNAIGIFVYNLVYNWLPAVGNAASKTLDAIQKVGKDLEQSSFIQTIEKIKHAFDGFLDNPGKYIDDAINKISASIDNWWHSIEDKAYDAGKQVAKRLADGLRDGVGPFIAPAMGVVGQFILDHLHRSPAKRGPLTGQGDMLLRGRELVNRLALGIRQATPNLDRAMDSAINSVTFGPGSVNVNYAGPLPSQSQMQGMGAAAGRGIVSQISGARLLARTM
jgi:hypothetical protein